MTRPIRTAEILAVGSELLTPHRIDTNSLFLTGRLNDLGVEVTAKSVVGDSREQMAALVRASLGRADLLITTGGLGPTADDLTREVVADVLSLPLDEDQTIVAAIRARFAGRGWTMPERNRRQARVPRGAAVLQNPNGTAPGLWIEADARRIALLPGPPREMQPMFDAAIAPRIAASAGGRRLRRRVLKINGRSESQVDDVSEPIYAHLSTPDVHVETTILATPGQIELHLTGTGQDDGAIARVLDGGVAALQTKLGDVVFSTDGRTLEQVVGDALSRRGWTIAAAESCTGGLLLGRLTEVPGSSGWVRGGVVAYANDVKIESLGVPAAVIERDGAVSESVAAAMATGVRDRLGATIGVGITGVAGPGGGTEARPVGMVVVAVAREAPQVRTFRFPGDREAVRRHSTSAALEMVRRLTLGS